jgi:hypothetical protein
LPGCPEFNITQFHVQVKCIAYHLSFQACVYMDGLRNTHSQQQTPPGHRTMYFICKKVKYNKIGKKYSTKHIANRKMHAIVLYLFILLFVPVWYDTGVNKWDKLM